MAAVAEAGADRIVLTSDNPRHEAPEAIIDDMREGLSQDSAVVELDRRAAIHAAIDRAGIEDIVLIAGKGHEKFQVVGDEALPFDDVLEARMVLRERRGVLG